MATGTAIYITDGGAVACRVEGSAKKPKLAHAAEMRFEPVAPQADGSPAPPSSVLEAHAKQLATWLKKEKLKGTVALCVDSSDVLLRDMRIAFKDRRQIDKVIAFQVEGLIPSTPIEELAVGYTVLSTSDEGSHLLVAAGKKPAIKPRIELLEAADVEATIADSADGGALNMRAYTPAIAAPEKPTVWIDLSGIHATIAVLEKDRIISFRSVLVPRGASAELAAARVEELQDAQQAEQGTAAERDARDTDVNKPKEEFAYENTDALVNDSLIISDDDVPDLGDELKDISGGDARSSNAPMFSAPLVATDSVSGARASDVKQPAIPAKPATASGTFTSKLPREATALTNMLTVETRRVLAAAGMENAPEELVITGAPANIHRSLSPIGKNIGVKDTQFADLLAPLVPKKHGMSQTVLTNSVLPAVTGVALKLIGRDESGVNFLTGDMSPTSAFDEIKNPLAVAATLLFMVAGVLLMMTMRERMNLQTMREANIDRQAPEKSWNDALKGADESVKKKYKFPSEEDKGELVVAAVDSLEALMNNYRAGNKQNYPPAFDGDIVYQKVLEAIKKVFGDQSSKGDPRDFSLKGFELRQQPSQQKTVGTLRLVCWMEYRPKDRSNEFVEELKRIMVDDPTWDGKDESKRPIKLFADDNGVRSGGASATKKVEHGRKADNGPVVELREFQIDCKLRELENPNAKKKTTTTPKN